MGASFSVIEDEEELVKSCTLFWAKNEEKKGASDYEVSFYIHGGEVTHIIETTLFDERRDRRSKHYYSNPKLTDKWKFDGALERLEEQCIEVDNVRGTPLNNEHPLLNVDNINVIYFKEPSP